MHIKKGRLWRYLIDDTKQFKKCQSLKKREWNSYFKKFATNWQTSQVANDGRAGKSKGRHT